MSKTSWQRETPYEWRFGEPIKGPVIPFGAMVEYHPKSANYQYLEYYSLEMLYLRREFGKVDASEIHARRLNATEVLTPTGVKIPYSQSQREQQNDVEWSMDYFPPQHWIILHEAKSSEMIFEENRTGLSR